MRESVRSEQAPAPVGPYSQAIRTGGLVFCAGQIALDPGTGQMVSGDVADQTRQVLRNLREVLRAAGTSFDYVVRTTVYLADLEDFSRMNAVYGEFFGSPAPARSTIQAARLPRDARVEIDAIATMPT